CSRPSTDRMRVVDAAPGGQILRRMLGFDRFGPKITSDRGFTPFNRPPRQLSLMLGTPQSHCTTFPGAAGPAETLHVWFDERGRDPRQMPLRPSRDSAHRLGS